LDWLWESLLSVVVGLEDLRTIGVVVVVDFDFRSLVLTDRPLGLASFVEVVATAKPPERLRVGTFSGELNPELLSFFNFADDPTLEEARLSRFDGAAMSSSSRDSLGRTLWMFKQLALLRFVNS